MTAVLGISCGYHDSAAALVVDGTIACAIQEERLSRIKNDPALPAKAAAACLRHAGLVAGDLDRVVFYEEPFDKLERVLVSTLAAFPRATRQFPRAIRAQLGHKIWVLDHIAEALGVTRDKVTSTDHHRAHAASAFYASPYDRAAVLTVDGVGEATSTAMWRGDADGLVELGRIDFPHSLGLLYAGVTAYLGFEVNDGEYKVMGLAAYGTADRFRDELARLLRLAPDGSFELDTSYFAHMADSELGFGPKLEQLLGPRRWTTREWDVAGDDRRYADIAAALQAVTEEALLALAREARRRTGADQLCLAGGVALNAVANRRLQREAGFARVFVQPAAGDAGGALGAAILGALELGDPRPAFTTCALGLPVDAAAADALARELGLRVSRCDDVAGEVATRVARGEVVGFCQGRFEWGPRALGQRSILADAHAVDSRERLNRAIKRREPFRPFAPAVLAGEAARYFDGAPDDMTPYMTTVCQVTGELAAVTHADGTARVQTVSDGPLADVLRRLPDPVVLNTSFNGPGEPIVASEVDALAFLIGHPIDAVVIGDVVVTK